MTIQTNARCARNLPQHFNGCACTVDPALTGEADVELFTVVGETVIEFGDEPDVEPATVNVRGRDYVVTHLGDDTFEVDIDGAKVTFFENPNHDDLVEEAATHAVEARLDRSWGTVSTIGEDSRTPWGAAQYANHVAPGIVSVGTAGHGGVKLSKERNAVIPTALRQKSGWYEEDCEATIVGMYFPEAFEHYKGAGVAEEDQNEWRRGQFEATVKNWFPDEYTKATGKPVAVEESYTLREQAKRADAEAFRAEHANDFVSSHGQTPSSMSNQWIPKDHAVVEAVQESTGEKRNFLVPQDQVIHDGMWGTLTVIDPKRALDVTDVMKAGENPQTANRQPIKGEALGIDYSGLTGRTKDAAYSELEQQFKWDDGSYSFAERLKREGVIAKRNSGSGYFIQTKDNNGYTVKKASFDALTGVPDSTTDLDRARAKVNRSLSAMDKISPFDRDKKAAAQERYLAASAEAKTAEAADRAANPLKYHDGIEAARTSAFERLVAERGISFD